MSDRNMILTNQAFNDVVRDQNRRLQMGQTRIRYPGATKIVSYPAGGGPVLVNGVPQAVLTLPLDPGRWLVLAYGQFTTWESTGPAQWKGEARIDTVQYSTAGGDTYNTADIYPERYPVEMHAVMNLPNGGSPTLWATGTWAAFGSSGMRFPFSYMIAYPV